MHIEHGQTLHVDYRLLAVLLWHPLAYAYLPTYSLYRITKVITSHKCYLEGRVGINYCRGGFACSTKGDHRHRHSILYGIQIDWTPCGAARKIYL